MADETLTRDEQTQIKRQQIIQAAHDLFLQQGYHGTSMRQIAQKAGIALGGLYNHFESKEQIFEIVLQDYHPYHEFLPALLQAEGEDIEEFVHNAVILIRQALDRRPEFFNLMFIELVEFNGIHMQRLFAELFPRAQQIIQKIQRIGSERLRPMPPVLIVRFFIGNVLAYYLTERLFAGGASNDFNLDAPYQMTEIYLHGILKN